MKGIPREVEELETHKITNSRSIRAVRENFLLSDYQREVLIGTLLGDGSLNSDGWSKNYRLNITQGDKQKDYLFWKFEGFRNCCVSSPSYQKLNDSWRIRTISHREFNLYAGEFYPRGRKTVPQNILNLLTPLSLSVWFMDAGALGSRCDGYVINSQNFTYQENEILRLYLNRKFSLNEISIHKDKKWWRLYVRKGSLARFRSLIEPHMIPSMKYKLYAFDPVETTRRPQQDPVSQNVG